MKYTVRTVGLPNNRNIEWPEDWPPPRLGDELTLPSEDLIMFVRVVEWNPEGDTEGPEPYVYVVVGPTRRRDG